MLAGTTRGIYSIHRGEARQVLESGAVRDLSSDGDRLIAGTAAGLFLSDDAGETWSLAGMEDREVWQTRAPDPTVPGGVMIGTDSGELWRVSNDAEWSLVASGMPSVLSVIAT